MAGPLHLALNPPLLYSPALKVQSTQIRMLADPQGKLAKALGVDADVPPLGLVSKRYSAVIKDNEVKAFNLEGDGFGTTCSLASATIGQLKEA